MPRAKVLVVGGGGGAANGGGGAGGYLYDPNYILTEAFYNVTVGLGGNGGKSDNPCTLTATAGGNSIFGTMTAIGGGAGGGVNGAGMTTGGSGGGAGFCGISINGAAGTAGQGNAGGNTLANAGYNSGGGGGGAGAGGNGANALSGNGGGGVPNSITGIVLFYAAGGGGGIGTGTAGVGGSGIGGNGNNNGAGGAGLDGRGAGGGGSNSGSTNLGGKGGTGTVVIAYKTKEFGNCTGGTKYVIGDETVHIFTTSGTFTVSYLPQLNTRPRSRFDLSGVSTPNIPVLNPNTITGIKLWLDANQIVGADGSMVASWTDLSGNSNDVAQATDAYKPLLKKNILNDLPVVRFDGSNDTLGCSAGSKMNFTGDVEFFVVMKPITTLGVPFHKEAQYTCQMDTGYNLAWADSSNWSYANFGYKNVGIVSGHWHVLDICKDGGSGVYIFNNGTLMYSVGFGSAITGTANIFYVGSYNGTGAYFGGDIAEVIAFDSILTVPQRTAITNYLKSKYML